MNMRLRAGAALIGLLLGLLPFTASLDLQLYDECQIITRALDDPPLHPDLVLVGLDERSARAGLGQDELAALARKLRASGCPAVIEVTRFDGPRDVDGVVRRFALPTEAQAQSARDLCDGEGDFRPLFQFAETQATLSGPSNVFRLQPMPLVEAYGASDALVGKVVVLGSYLQSGEQTDVKTPTGSMNPLQLAGCLWDGLLRRNGWRPVPPLLQGLITLLFVAAFALLSARLRPAAATLAFVLFCLGWLGLLLWMGAHGWFARMMPGLFGCLALLCADLALQWPRAASLLRKLAAREAEPTESEVREASILFTMLPACILAREGTEHHEAARMRRSYSNLLGEVCARHQGIILDQQGDAQMVGFGTVEPRQAHALRAVAAALDLRERVPALVREWGMPDEPVFCGVCTGPVAWGEVGASSLKATAAIGDTTNTAARLMGAAKKLNREVLVAAETLAQCGPRLGVEALEPLLLKGKVEPIAVYEARALETRPQPERPTPPRASAKAAPGLAVLLTAACVGASTLLGPMPFLDGFLWDRPLVDEIPQAPPVVIAGIDEACLEISPWPWPRGLHARVIDTLTRAGARGLFYDLLFDAPSASVADDNALAEAVMRSPIVVLAAAAKPTGLATPAPPPMMPPLDTETLRRQGKIGLAHTHFDWRDDSIRSLPTVYRDLQPPYPSAALALAARVLNGPVEAGPPLTVSEHGLPDESLVRWHRPVVGGRGWPDYRYVSYAALLDPPATLLASLKGAVVLVGDAMPGESDTFKTPVGSMKGVEVHAQLMSTLARPHPPADFRERPVSVWVAVALVLAFCWVGLRARDLPTLALCGLGALVLSLAAHRVLLHLGWVLGPQPVLAVAVAAPALLLVKALLSVSALRRFVPNAVLGELVASGEARDRSGEATVLVTDIRGYTSLSEKRGPAEVLSLLNQYHEETVACYARHGGVVLTYQGDAQLVVFGLLTPSGNAARAAVTAAVALEGVVARLRAHWSLDGDDDFNVGAGLCTGLITVGLLHAGQQSQYTVIGDTVRRAHRVQSLSDALGRMVLVDARTRQLCGDTPALMDVGTVEGVGVLFTPAGQGEPPVAGPVHNLATENP